jgi:CPA1 family monovalent cation:H+ antiporter
MYYAAEHFHFSGLLAVVSGGLLLSARRQRMLNYRSRVEGVNVWTNIVFVMNGLVFLLIGLQLPLITGQLGEIGVGKAIGYGLAISLVLILTRMLCTFGASLFTRFMSHFIKVADPNPGWKGPVILGWAGMRGVVSLAAALSIPILINQEQAFPFRNLILFITFIVILVTLVLQGLTLPWVIRKVNLEDKFAVISELQQEMIIRKKIAATSLHYLQNKYGDDQMRNDHIDNLKARLQLEVNFFQQPFEELNNGGVTALDRYQGIYLDILNEQRKLLAIINTH